MPASRHLSSFHRVRRFRLPAAALGVCAAAIVHDMEVIVAVPVAAAPTRHRAPRRDRPDFGRQGAPSSLGGRGPPWAPSLRAAGGVCPCNNGSCRAGSRLAAQVRSAARSRRPSPGAAPAPADPRTARVVGPAIAINYAGLSPTRARTTPSVVRASARALCASGAAV